MHNLDRTQREAEFAGQELNPEHYEYSGEAENIGEVLAETLMQEAELYETQPEAHYEAEFHESHYELPLHEAEEMELAAEFLEITNEAELDRFLGNLFKKIARGASQLIKSPIGRTITGALKPLARAALPTLGKMAGAALGSVVPGAGTAIGGMLGGQLASMAGNLLGLELEGLSGEDREFEIARRVVRVSANAINNAAKTYRPGVNPRAVARTAIAAAVNKVASDLNRNVPVAGNYCAACSGQHIPGYHTTVPTAVVPVGSRRRGTWIRNGRQIIVYGA
ncbi:MAG: hypothetical protein HZA78_07285 [Candidatus Schekmanbacteria bacterium]|nr:hypothetical protein [Candidatus Schekmanbacteria bacterium]